MSRYRSLIALPFFLVLLVPASSQPSRGWLTIDTIMRDPAWMGTFPSRVRWSEDGARIYFTWRSGADEGDSLYKVPTRGGAPQKVAFAERKNLVPSRGSYDRERTRKIFVRDGDIFVTDIHDGSVRQLTKTLAREYDPLFTFNESSVSFKANENLFLFNLRNGRVDQLTDFRSGSAKKDASGTELHQYLKRQQLELFDVLRKRKKEREARKSAARSLREKRPKPYYTGKKGVSDVLLSPDERWITFVTTKRATGPRRTIVPSYVTESGFTEDITSRTKVGEPMGLQEFFVLDRERDTVRKVEYDNIQGVLDTTNGKNQPRPVWFDGPYWSDDGKHAFVQLYSQDNKDRWIVRFYPESASFGTVLDRQHDDAWIGGPGNSRWSNAIGWMPESRSLWYQSEEDGWSHLYTVNIDGSGKKQLTHGRFEVYNPSISRDKERWYFSSNEEHYGERHFYSMPLLGGKRTKITTREGRNDAYLSPDEERIAVRYSFSNKPPELYIMDNVPGQEMERVTNSISREFASYEWRAPEILSIPARDGIDVPARLYVPEMPNGAAVVFVHGAGYLQNAHKWWSNYFREYMFHNLLADKGYTVLDIDYRGSAGLGRDWRTAIYRFMGGRDLDDQVDAARWLVKNRGIDSARIGIYGGSYGGFITFMAMFTAPGVFAAGAALRPVTDWAHYNHGYTSNILNIPQEDSVAYRRSSPVYHAEGLKGALLICHGMIDTNVHFQDAVRVVQRLIELKKENWELAVYPLESHGFREPTSWMDEYKRILKLFEEHL